MNLYKYSSGQKEIHETLWNYFDKTIFGLLFTENANSLLFNQYNQIDIELDLPNADLIRRDNLFRYVSSFTEWPRILVVGEAPGWRGCRFSGVPFTSEAQLVSGALPFSGNQSSRKSSPYCEASATIFWRLLQAYHPRFLIWNCVPFHPHRRGEPLTNRSPTVSEMNKFKYLLDQLIGLLAPKQIIAIGRSAGNSLHNLAIPCIEVRHPSHGGSKEFSTRMARILQSSHVE